MIVDSVVLLAQLVLALTKVVGRLVGRSVPRSDEQRRVLAERLYPHVARMRQEAAQGQFEVVYGELVREHGLMVSPAPVRPYPPDAVVSAIATASRLESGAEASLAEFRQRLAFRLGQHVQNAARELVIDTANLNSVQEVSDEDQARWDEEEARRDMDADPDDDEHVGPSRDRDAEVIQFPTVEVEDASGDTRDAKVVLEEATEKRQQRESKAEKKRGPRGVTLGWARVLVGEVNCAFCAMLASRGAVYKSEKTAGFEAHGKCDCVCTLVVKGESWEGDAEAALLQDMWEDARDNPNEYELSRMEHDQLDTPAARFRSRFNKMVREGGVERFKSEAAAVAESRVAEMRERLIR